jgi:hypothetical protein
MYYGIPGGIRTPTNGFGDRSTAVILPRYCLVQPTGIEPVSTGLQSAAMTTSAKVALNSGTPVWNRTTIPKFVASCIVHYTTGVNCQLLVLFYAADKGECSIF